MPCDQYISFSEQNGPSLDVQILPLSIALSDPLAPSDSDLPFKQSGPRSHDSGSDSGSQPGSQTSEYTGIPLVHACSCSPSPCPRHSIRTALVLLMSVHGHAAATVLVLVFGVCWLSSSLPVSISLHALFLQTFSLHIVYSSFSFFFFVLFLGRFVDFVKRKLGNYTHTHTHTHTMKREDIMLNYNGFCRSYRKKKAPPPTSPTPT